MNLIIIIVASLYKDYLFKSRVYPKNLTTSEIDWNVLLMLINSFRPVVTCRSKGMIQFSCKPGIVVAL